MLAPGKLGRPAQQRDRVAPGLLEPPTALCDVMTKRPGIDPTDGGHADSATDTKHPPGQCDTADAAPLTDPDLVPKGNGKDKDELSAGLGEGTDTADEP